MAKIVVFLILILALVVVLYPKALPYMLRRLGRSVGDLGRAGREIASGQEVEGSPLARYEIKAGQILQLKIEATTLRTADATLAQLVQNVGERVAAGARRREIPYRFTVIEDEQPNAFAVPGGAVFITRSLVELCGGDVGALAGVIGHEIAHIDCRHAIYRLTTSAVTRAGAVALTLGRALLLRRIAGQMQDLLVKGYGRDQELEADRVGAELAGRAGYDPGGLERLLARLQDLAPEGDGVLADFAQYFASHPPLHERRASLRRMKGS